MRTCYASRLTCDNLEFVLAVPAPVAPANVSYVDGLPAAVAERNAPDVADVHGGLAEHAVRACGHRYTPTAPPTRMRSSTPWLIA